MKTLRTPDESFADLPGYRFTPRYAEVADGEGGTLRVHYVREGDPTAPVVLLMHGEPSWSYLYRKMIPVLTGAGLGVVAPDLVGFGRSDKPTERGDYSFARHLEWMRELLFDHLELTDINLVCQDWGGLIGLRLVGEHPDRFARVVAANTFLPTGDASPGDAFFAWQKFSQEVEVFPTGFIVNSGCVSDLPADVQAAYDAPFPDESYKAGARAFPLLVPSSPDDPAHDAIVAAWVGLAAFDRPFLTAFSDGDPITRGSDAALVERIAGAKGQPHTTIAGGGHFLQEDKGEELARVVVDFIGVVNHSVIVVGAGFSGIGMAIRLREMGIDDFVVLDRGNDLGGTWRDNSYPGAACDVPSNLYSFSFDLNPRWSRSFPSQTEIWDYMRRCVDRHDVADHLRYHHEVDEARWDEDRRHWRVRVKEGQEYTTPVLIWATGSLSEPSIPAFPGLDSFRGKVFHSARWEHGFDLTGKRVCVVGTGASAIQFVPQIQPIVQKLYLHQRTPPWIFPRRDRAVSSARQALYRLLPATQRLGRLRIYLMFEFLLSVFIGTGQGAKHAVRKRARDHLFDQVADEALRQKLTPHYEPGCKRLLLSDDYYPALSQPNVEVIDCPVASFTAHEAVGQDGVARPVDVVIMGTGFEAAEPPYAEHIVGRDGARLSEVWKANGVEAYAGSTVSGFPNLFMMIGPNATLAHNSMIYMIESHINYIASAVRFMARPGVAVVEVKPTVQRRFNDRLQARLEHSVWVEGGCASWYLDHRGCNTTLWPDHTWKFRRLTRRFHPGEYTVLA